MKNIPQGMCDTNVLLIDRISEDRSTRSDTMSIPPDIWEMIFLKMDIWGWIFGNSPAVEVAPKIVKVQHMFVVSLGIPQLGHWFAALRRGFVFVCGR